MYSKESKCDFGLLRNYAGSSNHMGFIQGGLDGWSIGDAEWWEVDAGLVVIRTATQLRVLIKYHGKKVSKKDLHQGVR